MALLSNGEVVVGALYEGQTVPAVTIFGWDDVLCPTTHAKHERAKRTAAVFEGRGLAATQSSKEQRKEVSDRISFSLGVVQQVEVRCSFSMVACWPLVHPCNPKSKLLPYVTGQHKGGGVMWD